MLDFKHIYIWRCSSCFFLNKKISIRSTFDRRIIFKKFVSKLSKLWQRRSLKLFSFHGNKISALNVIVGKKFKIISKWKFWRSRYWPIGLMFCNGHKNEYTVSTNGQHESTLNIKQKCENNLPNILRFVLNCLKIYEEEKWILSL